MYDEDGCKMKEFIPTEEELELMEWEDIQNDRHLYLFI